MTTIAIADDHELVREGIRALLETEAGFRFVGDASNGLDAVRLVERVKPDVLLLDISMPFLDGLAAIREIRRTSPRTRIVIISMHSDETHVARAFREGALGYVPKQSPTAEIITAVREAAEGRRYIGTAFSQRAIDAYLDKLEQEPEDTFDTLSDREREVFSLAAEGLTNNEIASRLFISPRTVETHRANVMKKLGLRTHTDLVLCAVRRGTLSPDKRI